MGELQRIETAITGTAGSKEELLERFLAALDVKPKTKETYRKALNQFFYWRDSSGSDGSTRAEILAYKNFLMDNYAAATVSAYLTAVRSFYRWLEAEKVFPNIAAGIKGAKSAKGYRKDTLTKAQAKAILEGIDRSTNSGRRNYALVNLLLRTGLRTIEAERANMEDIRQEAGQALLYIQGKGRDSKDDFIILTPATLDPIREYIAATGGRKPQQPIFTSESHRNPGKRLTTRSISRIVKNTLRNAGIDSDRITAHSLRHTAITFSLLNGATLQEAQAMARHSNIQTTLVYAHNLNRINSAAEHRIDDYLDE